MAMALRLRDCAHVMKVLRTGGEYADRHIRRRGVMALRYFVGFIAVCATFFFVSYEIIALLGLVLAFKEFAAAYDRWENWFLGKRGELAVTRALNALPDRYVLLNDLMLPNGRGNVDHFLIGPNCLFVIETKNYDANVRCDRERWLVNGKPVTSLSRQVKANALAVRNSLQAVFTMHGARLPYIEPILTFVKHTHRLELTEPTVHVLKSEELVSFIREYEENSRCRQFTPELVAAIVGHVQLLQNQGTLGDESVAESPTKTKVAQI